MSRRGLVLCGVAALLFGISAPLAAQLTADLHGFGLAGCLYLGAALAVLPVAGRSRPTLATVRRGAGRLAVAVVVGGAIGPVLLALGLARAPAATSSLLLNLELVFTVLLAAVLFREHLGARVVAGTVLVTVASVVLGWGAAPDVRVGALLLAGACLCWAVDNGVTAALDELAPAHITLAKGVIAGTGNLLIGIVVDGPPDLAPVLAALVIGAFGYGLSITLWVAGARELGAARGQLVFATAPFLGAVVAWTLLAEPISAPQAVAVGIALLGVALVADSAHVHHHRHTAVEHDHGHRHDDDHHDHPHRRQGIGRHQHTHRHPRRTHAHTHVPDLHHRHPHDDGDLPPSDPPSGRVGDK